MKAAPEIALGSGDRAARDFFELTVGASRMHRIETRSVPCVQSSPVRVFSFHLAKSSVRMTTGALVQSVTSGEVPGLRHAECMAVMTLGSSILSPARMQLTNLAVFAAWESEIAIERFLGETALGRRLSLGWHVRLEFVRRWGRVAEFEDLPESAGRLEPNAPVVAVTLARLKLPQVPRFIRWGKPVEELVRDQPGATLALAAIRPPRTVSTFSAWRSLREMTDMVHGRGAAEGAKRHATAMLERSRKDFHHEFTTLRFRALSEHGEWQGRSNIVPRAT